MKISVLKTTLAAFVLVSASSRLRAGGDPQTPPTPPVPPAPAVAPAPPVPPVPPEAPRKRTKRVVVTSPEKEIVVDGERVYVWNDDEEIPMIADIEGMDEHDGHPGLFRWHGHAGGGFIGVRPIEMTTELRQHFGAPKDAGVLVGSVESDGPAAKAGLQVGDIMTAVDGQRIDSTGGLVRLVRHKKGGETIQVEVLRNRAAKTLTVTVSERPDNEMRVGEFGAEMPGFAWKFPGHGRPMLAPPPPDYPELQWRLEDLEKRLKELEGRTPGQ